MVRLSQSFWKLPGFPSIFANLPRSSPATSPELGIRLQDLPRSNRTSPEVSPPFLGSLAPSASDDSLKVPLIKRPLSSVNMLPSPLTSLPTETGGKSSGAGRQVPAKRCFAESGIAHIRIHKLIKAPRRGSAPWRKHQGGAVHLFGGSAWLTEKVSRQMGYRSASIVVPCDMGHWGEKCWDSLAIGELYWNMEDYEAQQSHYHTLLAWTLWRFYPLIWNQWGSSMWTCSTITQMPWWFRSIRSWLSIGMIGRRGCWNKVRWTSRQGTLPKTEPAMVEFSLHIATLVWGSHFDPHPKPQKSLVRIFHLQPGLKRKLFLRKTCCRAKTAPTAISRTFTPLVRRIRFP